MDLQFIMDGFNLLYEVTTYLQTATSFLSKNVINLCTTIILDCIYLVDMSVPLALYFPLAWYPDKK